MRRSGMVLAAVVMLVGCESRQNLHEYMKSKLSHCEDNKDVGNVNDYKNKTYWVNKNALLSVCDDYSDDSGCTFTKEIALLHPGDSFVVADVWCEGRRDVAFQVVTASGIAGWVHVNSYGDGVQILKDHDIIDHPRKEKAVGGPVRIGMTHQQVIDSDLGLPDAKSSWETKGHLTEVWKYRRPDNTSVFFSDGVVYMIKN